MSPPRVALVAGRFWPFCGGDARCLGHLAVGLAERGAAVTVVTPRWQRRWPPRMLYRGVQVERMPGSLQGVWNTTRYVTATARWLRDATDRFDTILSGAALQDAFAAVGGARRGVKPVIVRCRGPANGGDLAQLRGSVFGRRIVARLHAADRLIATEDGVREELLSAGFAPSRIELIPDGVPLPPARSEQKMQTARAALATLSSSLHTSPGAPLFAAIAPAEWDEGLADLITVWAGVASKEPSARLVVCCPGPVQSELYHRVEAAGLTGHIVVLGQFDDYTELLAGADVLLAPWRVAVEGYDFIEAMAHGLPILAADLPAHRAWAEDAGLYYPSGHVEALAALLSRLLDDPPQIASHAACARRRVARRHRLDDVVGRYFELCSALPSAGDSS